MNADKTIPVPGADVVIEIRGGCLAEVYSAKPGLRVVLIDWDCREAGELFDDMAGGGYVDVATLDTMPADTRREYEHACSQA